MKIKKTVKFISMGFFLGLLFPIIRFIMDVIFHNKYTIKDMYNSASSWMILVIPFIFALFFYIIALYIEKMVAIEKSKSVNEYEKELKRIIDHLNIGICVINNELIIEKGYNKKFEDIFGNNDYENKSIYETIFKGISSSLKKEIDEFFQLIFENITTSNEMLNDVSPFRRFEYAVTDNTGNVQIKVLSINVVRIFDLKREKINKIMLLIEDITLKERLKKEIKEKEEEYNRKYEVIISLLTIDQELIKRFINELELNLKYIGDLLRNLKQNEINDEILIDVLKKLHSLKGESFSLGFKDISEAAEELEKYLKEIKGIKIDFEKTLNIISLFERLQYQKDFLYKNIKEIENSISIISSDSEKKVNKKIENIKEYFNKVVEKTDIVIDNKNKSEQRKENERKEDIKNKNIIEKKEKEVGGKTNYKLVEDDKIKNKKTKIILLKKELELVIKNSSSLYDKKIDFYFNSDVEEIKDELFSLLKETFIHLIRNSVAHGIETVKERVKKNKSEEGLISIEILKKDRDFVVYYSDDGIGLDYRKILNKAIQFGLIKNEEAEKLSKSEITKIIFKDEFSTSDEGNMIAGTGVGMSVIKENILEKLNGKIKIVNNAQKGLRFEIIIPDVE